MLWRENYGSVTQFIPAQGKWRQEGQEFKVILSFIWEFQASLGYMTLLGRRGGRSLRVRPMRQVVVGGNAWLHSLMT